jgi:hypothetical protein
MTKVISKFPKQIQYLKNIIFYGPSGVGKYTQMLCSIKKYSPTDLKYEKKISITYNKQQYFFKISDIHYEIDMSLLGCNAKLLWHEIYQQIIDIISAKTDKSGIIVCKYFSDIHNELLENFYSYMQHKSDNNIDIKYILLTEQISFIPDNILNCCEIIPIARPTKTQYNKCLKNKLTNKMINKLDFSVVTNVKSLHNITEETNVTVQNYKIISDKIIQSIKNINEIKFLKFRDLIYDLLIYHLNISDCIWYILSVIFEENLIKPENMSNVLIKTNIFFQYYNNNYRPIYHLENYFFYLASLANNIEI